MPFRTNFFGDHIAQPGTEFAEIDLCVLDTKGFTGTEIWGADLFADNDENFKFGGELMIQANDDSQFDEGEGEPEPQDLRMSFDGFETRKAARDWLIDTIGLSPSQINEEN